jgi:hypothetical protein|tara:strand:- start:730 stop:963 length:234 start_codon:yes stop_codon:yes gene_type:complete
MAKIQKITSERDKLIEKLIDDKNSLYMINKKLKKEIEVYKSQNEYLNRKCRALTENYREMLDEKLKDKPKKRRPKDS